MTPPSPDEVEVTLLGKGFGESIVIHAGDSNWIVIDSLIDDDGKCAPLVYLEEMGVKPSDLKLVILTHWHGDHIAGISKLLSWSPMCQVAMPAAFGDTNFNAYTRACLRAPRSDDGPLKEIARVGDLIADGVRPAPIYAAGTVPLLTLLPAHASHGHAVVLTGLSPSNRDVHQFLIRLAHVAPGPGVKKPIAHRENDASVVAWLELGGDAVLLGADLETVAAPDRGWDAVIASPHRPGGRASLYKVAHHGSDTGHHDGIWTTLLNNPAIAIIAPWNKSGGLPREADKARILALSHNSYITSPIATRKYRQVAAELGTLEKFNIDIMDTNHRVGTIRLRKRLMDPIGAWQVELMNGADHLRNYVARA